MGPVKQLPLDVGLRELATFTSFVPGDAAAAVAALQGLAAGGAQQMTLWGPAGVGKTHLLQAVCHAARLAGHSSMYLPLGRLRAQGPGIVEGLAELEVICLDELHVVLGDRAWERALCHLINQVRDYRHALVMALRDNPGQVTTALPDLGSRLLWGPVFWIGSQDDAVKLAVLQHRAQQRGFELPEPVGYFLLNRYQRDLVSLLALLERIDNASLAAQRRVTIPFIREILQAEQNRTNL